MIPLFKPFIPPWEVLGPRLQSILYSGYIAEGDAVAEFEKKLSEFTGYPNIITTSSGTAALHLALMLAGVKEGDEVISTPMTAEPTNIAIKHAGGTVVWADVQGDGLINQDDVEQKCTEKAKAVIGVDYGGNGIKLDWTATFGPPSIRDSAHSLCRNHYAKYYNGYLADFTIFSFQSIKTSTTIDGGALAIRDPNLLPLARRLRWFGIDRKATRTHVDIKELGYKYHMNNVTATIGLVQLEYIDDVLAIHQSNGKYYDNELHDVNGITVLQSSNYNTYWLYTLLAENRDALIKKLQSRGIACGLVHRRNDEHSLFSDSKVSLPGLDYFYSHYLHIPCGWWVTEEDREFIARMIKEGW